jgi:hypothetical protein
MRFFACVFLGASLGQLVPPYHPWSFTAVIAYGVVAVVLWLAGGTE